MVAAIVTFKVAQGKYSEAKGWITRWIEKREKDNPDTKRFLLQPISGDMGEIVYVSMRPSLAALEESDKKRKANSEYDSFRKEYRESGWFLGREVRLFDVVE